MPWDESQHDGHLELDPCLQQHGTGLRNERNNVRDYLLSDRNLKVWADAASCFKFFIPIHEH